MQEGTQGLTDPSHGCCAVCLVSQSCLIFRDPVDCSPPGSSVPGMLQATILEWVATPSSRGSSQPRDLPNPGIEPRSPALQMDSLQSEPPGKPKNAEEGSLSLLQGESWLRLEIVNLLHPRSGPFAPQAQAFECPHRCHSLHRDGVQSRFSPASSFSTVILIKRAQPLMIP